MSTEFSHFVVGVDDSDESRHAFEWACHQAGNGSVAAIHAFPPVTSLFAASAMIDTDPIRAEHAELLKHTWAEPPVSSDARITSTIVDDDTAAALSAAGSHRPDSVIVIGQHSSTPQDDHHRHPHHVGRVASRLCHVARQPVAMVTTAAPKDLSDKIAVVAVHGPAHANHRPLEFAAHLAQRYGARLHLVSVAATATTQGAPIVAYGFGADVIDPVPVRDATSAALDSLVSQAKAEWPGLTVTGTVVSGHPVTALATAATDVGAALVVVGNHHHGTLLSMVTDAVVRHLPSHVESSVVAVPVDSDS